MQQLSSPNINQRDRELLFTVLSHFNPAVAAATSTPPENNMPHPVLPNNVNIFSISYPNPTKWKLIHVLIMWQYLDVDAEYKFTTKYANAK